MRKNWIFFRQPAKTIHAEKGLCRKGESTWSEVSTGRLSKWTTRKTIILSVRFSLWVRITAMPNAQCWSMKRGGRSSTLANPPVSAAAANGHGFGSGLGLRQFSVRDWRRPDSGLRALFFKQPRHELPFCFIR